MLALIDSGVNSNEAEVERFLPKVRDFVTLRFPDLRVFETHASIDMEPIALTNFKALQWVATDDGVSMEVIAPIGYSRGAVPAIEAVGDGFSPQNGALVVRRVADIVTNGALIDGVSDAYQWCVRHNKLRDSEP